MVRLSLSNYVTNIFSITGCLNLIFAVLDHFSIFVVKTYMKMFNT